MAVIDLYSPRIHEEGETRRANMALFQRSLESAAKTWADYSINKQTIDKAYADIATRAEIEKLKLVREQEKQKDELKVKRWNTAVVAAGVLPPDQWTPQMENALVDAMHDLNPDIEFPRDESGRLIKTPDMIQRLRMAIVDEKGQLTPQALGFMAEATKPMSDMGKIVGDIQMYRERGLGYESPEIQALFGEARKKISTTLGEQTGRYIDHIYDTQGPAAAFAAIKELKTAGAPKMGDVKVTLPSEGEREDIVKARGTLQLMNDIKNLYDGMRADQIWTVGPGVEMASSVASFVPGLRDPRAKELYASINKVKSDMLRIAAGLAQTDREVANQMGYVMRSDLSIQDFETALKLNIKWAERNLENVKAGMGAYKQVTPPMPEIEKPSAKEENTSTTTPERQELQKRLDEIDKRIERMDRLRKRRKGGVVPPVEEEPQGSLMFKRFMG